VLRPVSYSELRNVGREGAPQTLPRGDFGWVAVRAHDQLASIRVSELDGNVRVRAPEFEKVRCAEMAQLVEVHPGPPERCAHRRPVQVQRGLREPLTPLRRKDERGIQAAWH
jgi:hypothetical protein